MKNLKKNIVLIGLVIGILSYSTNSLAGSNANYNKRLISAALEGRTTRVITLIKRGADVNAKEEDGWTALMHTAYEGHTETVTALIENGADVNAKDNIGRTALRVAASEGHTETVTVLIENGADVNAKDKYGYTPLMLGNTEIVTALIENGADVNAKDNKGRTALGFAVSKGNTKTTIALIKNGADLNIEFEEKTLLTIALQQKGVPRQIPLLLYQHGVKIKDYSEYSKLLLICSESENSAGIMASLLDLKQFKDENGNTLIDNSDYKQLLYACSKTENSAGTMALLIGLKQFKDKNGITLIDNSDYKQLLYACSKTEKSVDTMKLLLNLDPFKDEVSEEMTTSLFFNAVGYGSILMFHFLLDNGATLHSQTISENFYNDFYKNDLYNFIKNKKNYEELSFLIYRGVDANRLVNIINSDYDDKISIQGEHNPLKIAKTIIDGQIELETKKQIRVNNEKVREKKDEKIKKAADTFQIIIFLILFFFPIGYLASKKYVSYVLFPLIVIVPFFLLFAMITGGIKGVAWILIISFGFILTQPVALIFLCFLINLIAAIYYFSEKEVSIKSSGTILTCYALAIVILIFIYSINKFDLSF